MIHNDPFHYEKMAEGNAVQVRKAVGLVTEQEMASVLGLRSVDTLATWRSQKRGPAYVKLGKTVFYTVNDFATWVQQEAQRQHIAAREAEKAPA